MYFYRAYGLILGSHFRIPNLTECEAQACQIEIAELSSNQEFEDESFENQFANWKASPGRFLLSVKDVAQFYVRDGKRIGIRLERGAEPEDVTAFLMGSAFAVLLQQRRFLTLHASAIATDTGAVLFIGHSGVGKSTTLAAMHDRGFDMITDDVAAVNFAADGTPRIVPSFAGGKLTARSLVQLGLQTHDYPMLRAEIEKYAYPLRLTGRSKVEIDRIVVLEMSPSPEIELKALSRSEAFQATSFFTFRKRFYDGMEMRHFHFDAISKLVEAVPVCRIRRPDTPFLLDELVDKVMSELNITAAHEPTLGLH